MASATTVTLDAQDGTQGPVLALEEFRDNRYRLQNVIPAPGGRYTFSVWCRASADMQVVFDVLGESFASDVSTGWTKIVHTVSDATDVYIDIYPMADTALYLYKGMLQTGQYDTDWKPAPEDAESEITTLTERTTTLETDLSVVQGKIESKVWQTDITAVTDPLGSKVTTLEDNYSTVSQTVEGIQTQVGSLETTVGDNYNTLDNKLTTLSLTADGLQTQVTSVQSTANAAQSAADAAQSSIDHLQVGGRNLYYTYDLVSNRTKARCTAEVTNSGLITLTCTGSDMYIGKVLTSGAAWDSEAGPLMDVEGADYVTFCVDNPLFTKNLYNFLNSEKKALSGYTLFSSASGTIQVPSGAKYLTMRVGFGASVTGSVYQLKIKVEKGNTPTDWTPAPEDTEAAITATQTRVTQTQTSILQQVSAIYATQDSVDSAKASLELSIGQKVGTDELISVFNASADEINLTGNRLVVDSTNLNLSADGTLTATNGNFAGTITAGAGSRIGGWSLTDDKIYGGDADTGVAVMQRPTADTTYVFAAGGTSHNSYADCSFRVTKDGSLYAEKGAIGAWSLTDEKIYGGDADTGVAVMQRPTAGTTYVFAAGGTSHSSYADCPYKVDKSGNVWASGMKIPQIQHGSVSITPSAANTPTGKAITFAQQFSGTPDVVATPATTTPGTVVNGVGVSSPSSTGATIYLTRTSTADTTVRWIAAS